MGIGKHSDNVWRMAVVLILVAVASGMAVAADEAAPAPAAHRAVYTRANAPAAPAVNDLQMRRSVSQYGITWTFDKEVPVGRFINGDWYVVGPVTVKMIDPKPRVGAEVREDELDGREKRLTKEGRLKLKEADRVRNGSMLNPPARQEVAYDSGIRSYFKRERLSVPPIQMKPGDSLVSTISRALNDKVQFPYHAGGKRSSGDASPVKTAAVLTCMAEPQPADAFRPSYCDTSNKVYLARTLKRELLRTLPRPDSTPKLDTWVRVFQRPWVNTGFFGFDQPMDNMPHYGQWVGQAQSMAGLMLMLNFPAPEKERLLVNVVQVGIDYWGVVRGGHPGWQGWGGHGSGRKFPIVFAGILLGDDQMAAPTTAFPKCNFGEDNQTMYGDCWTGAKVCFAGHSGMHPHAEKKVPRPKWGPYEHLHPSQWDKNGMKNMQSEAYRRANSSSSWPGQALVIRMLHGEKHWNHAPFFDYVDRWMYEDDKEFRHIINEHFPQKALVNEKSKWFHQGQAWEKFVTEMWKKYRPTLEAPIDGWKKAKGGAGGE